MQLQLEKIIKPNYWTAKELARVRKLYPQNTAVKIAEKLGRSVQVVRKKVFDMGLKKYNVSRKPRLGR